MRRILLVGLTLVALMTTAAAASAQDADGEAKLAEIEQALREGDADARVAASKWVRGHGVGPDAQLLPLLEANLEHPDAEVRTWTVLALATLGEPAVAILDAALPDESDEGVRHQMEATLRHLREDVAQRDWLENHPCRQLDEAEVLTWEIRELCDPIGSYPPIIKDLGDGTSLYGSRHRTDDTCFRGRRKEDCHLKCMPVGTQVATPDGPVPIEEIAVGDRVWTVTASGEREAAEVVETRSMEVRDHELVEIELDDGRVVSASATHPAASGELFGELAVGDAMDGARVVRIERVPYRAARTHDIRPAGASGLYIAEDVVVGTTIDTPLASLRSPPP